MLALFLASRERGRGCGRAYVENPPDGRERHKAEGLLQSIEGNLRRRAESSLRNGGRVVWEMIVSNLRLVGSPDTTPDGEGSWRVWPSAVVCNAAQTPAKTATERFLGRRASECGALREEQISAGGGAEAVRPREGLRGGHRAGVRALFLASRERGRGCGRAHDKTLPDGRERPEVEDLELCIADHLRRRAESRWRDGDRIVWGTIIRRLSVTCTLGDS